MSQGTREAAIASVFHCRTHSIDAQPCEGLAFRSVALPQAQASPLDCEAFHASSAPYDLSDCVTLSFDKTRFVSPVTKRSTFR